MASLQGRFGDDLREAPGFAVAGALLAAGQLLCVGRFAQVRADRMLARGGEPLCWPLWPGCGEARVLGQGALAALLACLGLLALATLAAFLRRSRLALPLLLGTQALILAVAAQDFRLRQNQFYMLTCAVLAVALVPDRGRALRYLVVLFYFWAGLLKLNAEWLSGAALYRPAWIPDGPLLRAACAWVVALELGFVFGLLARSRVVYALTLAQLLLFAAASLPVVGPFYPLLMALLLAACAALRREGEPPLRLVGERPATLAAAAIFCALQLVPRLFPGDPAITGEGRLFALHMFDARVECESTATVRAGASTVEVYDLRRGLPVRTACDPAVLYARGRTLCAHLGAAAWTVDLHLASRRSTEPALRPVVDLIDFCRHPPQWHALRHNEWIRSE